MAVIVVAGALANKPRNGGAAWTRLSWPLGLRRLGHEVYFVEEIAAARCTDPSGASCAPEQSVNLAYFREVTERVGLGRCSWLVAAEDGRPITGGRSDLEDVVAAADLLVNIGGHLTVEGLKSRFRKRAFIDQDPGYTQFWQIAGLAREHLRGHDVYFTVGENIGTPECTIPICGIAWHPLRQPVVLSEWPAASPDRPGRFTTVASWRGPYGRIVHEGTQYGLKAHEFRKFAALPLHSAQQFEIALSVDPADRRDAEELQRNQWRLADPKTVAADPFAFRSYVQSSSAEFSVAQGIYVDTQSGWFSDRTVRYLASGKPALVQDTGFGRAYPTGCGLVPFRTLEDAVRGADRIASDYGAHARAARAIAEEFFDSDKVVANLLRIADVTS
jgi:hypothetical protein